MPQRSLSHLCDFIRLKGQWCLKEALIGLRYECLLMALSIVNNEHRNETNERDYDMVDDTECVVEKSHEETNGDGE
ncbi:hypothetical protein TNCV_1177831 [Trichonephila clavipes]|nr:hypothetical protein TNCV_1177831 [Trichonephila clavipes]